MDNLLLVLSTFPSEQTVRQIGTQLVKRQLIACINCVPNVVSIYSWEGKVCEEQEWLGIMKTRASQFSELQQVLTELHPYDVPELVALSAEHVSEPYLRWVLSSTGSSIPENDGSKSSA